MGAEYTERMLQLERRVATFEVDKQLMGIIANMFSYCEENMTASSIPEFKNELIELYSAVISRPRGLQWVYCIMTREFLPKVSTQKPAWTLLILTRLPTTLRICGWT